eukprot:m.196711 g.196711  ORF g.196711 m.196711 type:complete len:594 (+) comp21840_c1_seq5:841-2622(+)
MFRVSSLRALRSFRCCVQHRALALAAPATATLSSATSTARQWQQIPGGARASSATAAMVGGTLLSLSLYTLWGEPATQARCDNVLSGNSQNHDLVLLKAVFSGDMEKTKEALENGASASAKHPGGWSALHVAACRGNASLCQLLLDHKASPDVVDEYSGRDFRVLRERQACFPRHLNPTSDFRGFTPLHYAVLMEDVQVVAVLQAACASPFVQDLSGHRAIDYAASEDLKRAMRQYEDEYESLKRKHKEKEEEHARLLRRQFPLEQRVKQHIVGQEGPIRAIGAAIRRRENKWHDEDKPLVFLFLGSSGIGKTELAKRVGQYLNGEKKGAFIRMDMTEFQEKHEVSKFIGSPPGYIGHDEGGQLTKQLAANPSAVVLFDEVEKAHPDVLTVLLQLFDEGRLTDGKGNTIECKDAIFIMTSNLAQEEIAAHASMLRKTQAEGEIEPSKDFREGVIRPILKQHFQRNEFIGRINEILYFLPFSHNELRQLVELQLRRWADKAKQRHKIELTWEPGVTELLCDDYDIHYGARSLQHAVERRVINLLAKSHEEEQLKPGAKVLVSVDGQGGVRLHINNPEEKAASGLFGFLGGKRRE